MTDIVFIMQYPIDQNKLSAYLQNHIEGFGNITEIMKFSDGQSNPTYKITTPNKTYVMRSKPAGELLKSAHMIGREYRVFNALNKTDVPVPTTYHLSDTENPIGPQFYIMEFLNGRIFWDPALPEMSASDRNDIYLNMATALAKLHNINANDVGLGDFGKAGNYFARQINTWSRQYNISKMSDDAGMARLMAWLPDNIPPETEDDNTPKLVHGDYRIDNMIFAHDSTDIKALLDWELSTLGHPLADLAYQCMQWRLPNNSRILKGLDGIERATLGIPTEDTYVDYYCKQRGIEKIQNWNFYIAFSYFRFIAILQGVVFRAANGNAANPENVDTMKVLIPLMINDAQELLD